MSQPPTDAAPLLLEPPFYLPELLAKSPVGGMALTSADFADDAVASALTDVLRASVGPAEGRGASR